jgi:type III restriction enzyme
VRDRAPLEIRFPRVEGYRVELPNDRLYATFGEDSKLRLTPDIVGPSITRNEGIIGEGTNLGLDHLEETRKSTVIYHVTRHLLMRTYRDHGGDPKLHLFGQLKRIVRQWLESGHLECVGNTFPAQLLYQPIADMACERIKAGITEAIIGDRPVKAILDPYNPFGSTRGLLFTTSKTSRYRTAPGRCHLNWMIWDSEWEVQFAQAMEAHPRVLAYVKNQNLGFEVPYRDGATARKYLPDFLVKIDDDRGPDNPLHLVVEIKGFRGEKAKDKANTMRTYWVPGVNNLGTLGRWAFAEFTEVYEIAAEFGKLVEEFLTREVA